MGMGGICLPHIGGEKLAQSLLGPMGVKCCFHDAPAYGHGAICFHIYYRVKCFFLSSAPGCDNIIVDFSYRYHGIVCVWSQERTGMVQFFLGEQIKKVVCDFFRFLMFMDF
jgi:hypothetical protein